MMQLKFLTGVLLLCLLGLEKSRGIPSDALDENNEVNLLLYYDNLI